MALSSQLAEVPVFVEGVQPCHNLILVVSQVVLLLDKEIIFLTALLILFTSEQLLSHSAVHNHLVIGVF